ncbi:Inner membrane protein YgaP [Poriferisphaera corsica]|uniref:Inner membrane protein YgaP n=1 Tax=Poriferisphaera corsica TaxID=2528020 RepID=A0A517YUL5_9BACT|nr:rhodanese-like domain-containing protein [Poriferisphaera corsica]QDU33943.1 Inner membrane protein YgaP [Poriferisphaera corsica]
MNTINPTECYKQITDSPTTSHLIDVRTPGEHAQIHANNAQLFPLDKLNPEQVISTLGCADCDTIYILCHSGARAQKAQAKFQAAGHANTVVVDGGTQAWAAADLPIEKAEKQTMSLQRQVQIAAGAMITLGVVLAFSLHCSFIAISAFVGLGLMFAGLTNTCGLAIFLAKMPWNNPKGCVTNCSCPIN